MNNTPDHIWTPRHQDLFDALMAERFLPNFCQRISLEHITIDRNRARSWRTWASSLLHDPGWPQIQAVLELPDAWPHIWQSLPPDAWSPQTAHYNSLFFLTLLSDALADNNFDLALYAFKEALAAANRALQPASADPHAPAAPQTSPIFTQLANFPFQDLDNLFQITLETDEESSPATDPQRTRFAWNALLHAQSSVLCEPLAPIKQQANTCIERILENTHADILALIRALDAANDIPEHFHAVFAHIIRFHARIQPPASNFYPIFEYALVAATNAIAADVFHAKRDDESEILYPVLKLVQPFNETLRDELKKDLTMPDNFREACAEFFVLQGDLQRSAEKRLHDFEQAIDIAPDHPRAAKRAAQTCLERANTLLLVTAPVPGFATQIPGGQRMRARVEHARDLYFRACILDPTNELLPTYHTEIALECERFNVPFDHNPDTNSDQAPPHDL